ncbi:MAG: MFS transporter, partial [Chlamydiia bacterium]|nr:MFS transporter [Chlamydiia bacterium]
MSTQGTKKVHLIGVFIWSLAAGFFLYEFFLRVFVGTLSTQVISGLNLTSQQFALLGLGYYLTYSLMQIPVGILVDRFGAHLLLTIATFLAALGGFWFAYSYGFINGFASRCFMGFGSSFAYVSLLILALNWFPRKYFGLMAGVSNLLGAIGPILAGAPLALLLNAFNGNWRVILAGIGGFGFVLAVIIGLFVRNRPKRESHELIHLDPSSDTLLQKLKSLLTNRQVYPIILFAGFNYVSIPLLGAYWGTSFLQAKGLELKSAATLTSLLWVGLALGAPLIGRIS